MKPPGTPNQPSTVAVRTPLFRGVRRLRIALIGMPNAGKSTLFNAVASTSPTTGLLEGTQRTYGECTVQIGLDEAGVIDLPSIPSLLDLAQDDVVALKYLLWGDERPPVSAHETGAPPAPFAPPDVLIQVIDATRLERDLALTLELGKLGRPMVIALNMADQAWAKGLHINVKGLGALLGMPVISTVATMGHGIAALFNAAVNAHRDATLPLPQLPSRHILDSLEPLSRALERPEIARAFRVPHAFLLSQFAEGNRYFDDELRQHFPQHWPGLQRLRGAASAALPRPLAQELHADRHHRAAILFEGGTRIGAPHEGRSWRYWLDEMFLHPRWGLIGSLMVFAAVLFVVFEVSGWLEQMTTVRLTDALSGWQPDSTAGIVARAVVDGLLGLTGIVVPYMIPLVLLLVALEEAGIMQRIAFVVDRAFHHIGLHGGVAVTFLTGLGCNVPAISSVAKTTSGRERVIASALITFVPCSARSAIILALAGKYLGAVGVLAIFGLTIVLIAGLGRIMARHHRELAPGQIQDIPPYALPRMRALLAETWTRTSDVLTIVAPLLIGGSVVLALLNHVGADMVINTVLTPITGWWLGLPVVLGVPILFGVLRKELSLLMIYQALGTLDVGAVLDWVQIMTLLLFLTFYIPCISTFAVMNKTIGRRDALLSVALSVGVALAISGVVRALLQGVQWFAMP